MPPFKSEYYYLLATRVFFLFKPFVESSQNFSIGPWWRSPRWKPPRLPARRRSNLLWRSAGTAHPTASVRLQRPRRRHPWRCLGEKSYESANRQGIGEREYMGCDWNPWFSLSFFKIGDWMLIQKKKASGKKDWNWHGEKLFCFGESWRKWIICSLLHFTDC